MRRPVKGGSPLVAWEPRSWPPPRSGTALRFRALGGSARTRRRRLHDDSESPWGTYPYLARPGSPAAYLEAYRHGSVKPARSGGPAIPEVPAPRFRADAGCIGGRLLRWSNGRLPSIRPKAKPCAEGRVPKAVRRRPSSRQTNSPLLRHSPTLAAWSGSREEVRHGAPRRIREPPHLSSRQVSGGEGYPSETKVRRGLRVVHGDKELPRKLGRNDLCPCGSAKRFQELLHALGRVRR
jgi:hypothetical protein